jgi:polysaccharide export outer membrane protein
MRFARNLLPLFCFVSMSYVFSSCVNAKKTIYFNNIQDTVLSHQLMNLEPVIRKSDLLLISVSSLNPEASMVFNSPNFVNAAGGGGGGTGGVTPAGSAAPVNPVSSSSSLLNGYLVNTDGEVKFPVIGNIKAEGLTKKQLEDQITRELVSRKLLIDPIVTIRFMNFRVTVIGEVARPSTINVTNERISILEALGLAGDLTIYGKRENVLLIREEGTDKIIHRMDLTSKDVLSSPYYYLKTNDIVYVEPNNARIASTSRTQQLLPIVLSALSFIAIIVTYTLKNN